jgi:hypothetical protein
MHRVRWRGGVWAAPLRQPQGGSYLSKPKCSPPPNPGQPRPCWPLLLPEPDEAAAVEELADAELGDDADATAPELTAVAAVLEDPVDALLAVVAAWLDAPVEEIAVPTRL